MLKAILLYLFGKVFLPPSVIHIGYGIQGLMHSNDPLGEYNIGQYFLYGMYAPLYTYFPTAHSRENAIILLHFDDKQE